MPGRSPTRATGVSSRASAFRAVRRTAAAAADSAAAIANRAETPERPSTAGGLPYQAGEQRDDLDQVLGQLGSRVPAIPGALGLLG